MVGPPGWLVGIVVGVAAVATLGLNLALFASSAGMVLAAVAAFGAGGGIAAALEPRHATRNAAIVATSIVVSIAFYLAIVFSRPAPPGASHGGPNVFPPASQQP